MTGQSNDAAERSAHVQRGDAPEARDSSAFVQLSPGVWQLRLAVERDALAAEVERLTAERDALRLRAEAAETTLRELGAWSHSEVRRLRRLWTYMQEAAADIEADEPQTAAEWLAEFGDAEARTRAVLAAREGGEG